MEGLRREDEACIRTAIAFVALAKHNRLLGKNANDENHSSLIQESNKNNDTKNDTSKRDCLSKRRPQPAIALPVHLPRQNPLPLHPKQAHLTHLLHLAKQPKVKTHDLRVFCLHLVKQLSQKNRLERLEFFSNELNGIVSITDATVDPVGFPLLEHILSFGGKNLADEMVPLLRDFLMKAETEDELAKWVFVAELTMLYVSFTRPAIWKPIGSAWCDLRSQAKTFRRTNGMELWRQQAFAHLSHLAMRYQNQERMSNTSGRGESR